MFIFYKTNTGNVEFTINGSEYPESLLGSGLSVIEVGQIDFELAGMSVIGGELVRVDLEPIIKTYLDKVKAKITIAREVFITTIVGQEGIYMRKEAEAVSYLAAIDPDLSQYPLLSAEIGITANTAYELAQIWVNMAAMWIQIAALLEGLRLSTNAQITNSENAAQIELAFSEFETSIDAIVG